ncbi:MAG: hypothetical protein M3444_03970 [Acidobacteriota bacterium]|nr:hypothetical protein [Acidobacteriota bacterium]MDQ5838925.1 hypothetical protein [Acidobacteriota bacterium]
MLAVFFDLLAVFAVFVAEAFGLAADFEGLAAADLSGLAVGVRFAAFAAGALVF